MRFFYILFFSAIFWPVYIYFDSNKEGMVWMALFGTILLWNKDTSVMSVIINVDVFLFLALSYGHFVPVF